MESSSSSVPTIRPFVPEDTTALLDIIGSTLAGEAISRVYFESNVLEDPNFRPSGLLIAEAGGKLLGFMLAVAAPTGWDNEPGLPCRGYITLFATAEESRRKGVATSLLESCVEYLHERGCSEILVSPYARGYFSPGVDSGSASRRHKCRQKVRLLKSH